MGGNAGQFRTHIDVGDAHDSIDERADGDIGPISLRGALERQRRQISIAWRPDIHAKMIAVLRRHDADHLIRKKFRKTDRKSSFFLT
jgi:hypothetical protein